MRKGLSRRKTIGMLIICAIVILLLLVEYRLNWQWSWTGFSTKTLWDWLQLLFIPSMLAIGGFWLNQIQKSREEKTTEQRAESEQKAAKKRSKTEQAIASDNQREAALQTYLDRISELLLNKDLRSQFDVEVRNVARVRTLTMLCQLDARRNAYVIEFLRESGLISADYEERLRNLYDVFDYVDEIDDKKSVINLSKANLSKAHLDHVVLHYIDFYGTDFREASLSGANLGVTRLVKADLSGANLSGANLGGADLREANLSGANLSATNLSGANLGRADLSGVDLQGSHFGLGTDSALFHGTNLEGATPQGADLGDSDLKKANLNGANLLDVRLGGSLLVPLTLEQAKNTHNGDLIAMVLVRQQALASQINDRGAE